MYDQALLQAYRARLPKRASDADFIDDDVYASAIEPSMETETEPRGLMDRLYQQQLTGQPIRGNGQGMRGTGQAIQGYGQNNTLPTTRRSY